jgi:hypothetical protein
VFGKKKPGACRAFSSAQRANLVKGQIKLARRQGTGRVLVGDHLAKIGDVLLDSGDFFWPGNQALVGYSGSILSSRVGKCVECVLQILVKRRARHNAKVLT